MEKSSFFMDKAVQPRLSDVEQLMPEAYTYWKELIDYISGNYPDVQEEWTHSGKKYGWSFRLRSKKRVVMYFSPYSEGLQVGFALGQAATDAVLAHPDIPFELKKELLETKPYREGRGLRIMVTSINMISIAQEIIKIKMNN